MEPMQRGLWFRLSMSGKVVSVLPGESSRHLNRVDQAVVGIAGVRAHGARADCSNQGGAFAGSAVNPRGVQRVPGTLADVEC